MLHYTEDGITWFWCPKCQCWLPSYEVAESHKGHGAWNRPKP
jgi:hypothetical protein